jgi:hypothetical protein
MISGLLKAHRSFAISLAALVISLNGISFAASAPSVTTLSPITAGMRMPLRTAVDSATGNFYLTDPWVGGVLKYNGSGQLLATIKTPAAPQGVGLDPAGNLIYVSQGDSVAILDQTGTVLGQLGQGAGQFQKANGIAVDESGMIYVVDSLANCVQVFNAAGQYLSRFGSYGVPGFLSGAPAGTFNMPTGIAYEKASKQLVVVDTFNVRIQFFDTVNYAFVKAIGTPITNFTSTAVAPLQFSAPAGVAFEYDATGALARIYVLDGFQGNLQVLDTTGAFLSYIGGFGYANGQLVGPSDVAFDAANRRLLVTNGAGGLTVYGIDGGTSPVPPPSLTINTLPATTASATISVSGTTSAGAAVGVALNGAVAQPATVSGTSWSYQATTLVPGNNSITVVARNAAPTATTGTASITLLYPAPALAIDPAVAYTTASIQTIGGSVDSGATVSVALNGATAQPATVSGTRWSFTVSLAEGANNITVTAVKPLSNSTAANTAITRDSLAPVLAVSALADGSYTSTQVQNISGSVSDANFDKVTVNGQQVAVTNGSFSSAVSLATGANAIVVQASDLAGNISTDSRTVNFDASKPVITVSTPADGIYTNLNLATLSGSVDKICSVTVAGAAAQMDGNNWTASVNLVSGLNAITIAATDLYGNSASLNRSITLDVVNPVVAITIPGQDLATNQANLTVSGTASDANGVTVAATVNGTPVAQLTYANGVFTLPVAFAAEGNYAVTVTATDAAGNSSTATRTIIFDKTAPSITLVPLSSYRPASLSGSVDGGASVTCSDKNGPVNVQAVITGTSWSVNLAGINYDPASFTITATDAAGNSAVKALTVQPPSGDLDGDGVVTVKDALQAIQMVAKKLTPTPLQLANGDIRAYLNNSTPATIDLFDALLILRRAVGLQSW